MPLNVLSFHSLCILSSCLNAINTRGVSLAVDFLKYNITWYDHLNDLQSLCCRLKKPLKTIALALYIINNN